MVEGNMNNIPEDRWEQQLAYSSNESIRWVPVFRLPKHGARIGLLDTLEWVVETAEGLKNIRSELSGSALLPFLEVSQESSMTIVCESLQKLNLPQQMADTLPWKETLRFAIGQGSAYWQHLGLLWLAAGEIDMELTSLLRSIVTKGLTQENRHLAQRLLRKSRSPLSN